MDPPRPAKPHHGPVFDEELQNEHGLVRQAPVLVTLLQSPRENTHDLAVIVEVECSLGDFCSSKGKAGQKRSQG